MGSNKSVLPRQQSRGVKTKQQILEVAADLASAEGLEGLSIGNLAKVLQMSKSGLYAHFGSKEELQLAIVELAQDRFEQRILSTAAQAEAGLPKLQTLVKTWVNSVEDSTYRGGCFFAAASAEFDDRPGKVRDEIARLSKLWIDIMEKETRKARRLGQLKPESDPVQIVFEIHALVQEANWSRQLFGNKRIFQRAKRGILACINRVVTAKGRRLLTKM